MCAGDGDDRVWFGSRGRGRALGGAGEDVIEGGGRLVGGAGNDRLISGGRYGVLVGGSGSDTFVDERGPLRPNVLNQETTACVSYRRSTSAIRADLGRGRADGEGRDRLQGVTCVIGTRFADDIVGTRFNDCVDSGRGGDSVNTGSGADLAEAGAGDDVVRLGAGDDDDNLHAGLQCDPASSYGLGLLDAEPNTLLGGDGDDYLTADQGDDVIDGGPGRDTGHGGGTPSNRHPYRGADLIVSIENPTTC